MTKIDEMLNDLLVGQQFHLTLPDGYNESALFTVQAVSGTEIEALGLYQTPKADEVRFDEYVGASMIFDAELVLDAIAAERLDTASAGV